jgi:DNA-binding response OmpR family regulator
MDASDVADYPMPETILIVDDEKEMADTCARVLRARGFNCLVAYDASKAFALMDSEHPALVVSDITMPDGDGFEVARHAGKHSPKIPVILMTAYHTPEIARNARQAGAAAYLRKPFPNAELIATVKTLLGKDGSGKV